MGIFRHMTTMAEVQGIYTLLTCCKCTYYTN